MMTRLTLLAAALAVGGSITIGQPPTPSTQPPTQPPEPTFRTQTAGARIDVWVTEGERFVPNLTATDFALTDSGVAQQVDVTSLSDMPVDVIIVLDTSASLGEEGLRHLVGATDTLLGRLRADDRAALVTFSRLVTIRSPLMRTRDHFRGILKGLKAHGTTSVIDATYAATTLRTQADRSALMLVFSDGVDTTSFLRPEKVVDTVRRSAVVPYAVVVGEGEAGFLRDLVTTGGGLFIPATETSQLERAFAQAFDNFRQRYVLTYTPRGVDASGWHPVTVNVKGGHRVRARPGYVVK